MHACMHIDICMSLLACWHAPQRYLAICEAVWRISFRNVRLALAGMHAGVDLLAASSACVTSGASTGLTNRACASCL